MPRKTVHVCPIKEGLRCQRHGCRVSLDTHAGYLLRDGLARQTVLERFWRHDKSPEPHKWLPVSARSRLQDASGTTKPRTRENVTKKVSARDLRERFGDWCNTHKRS